MKQQKAYLDKISFKILNKMYYKKLPFTKKFSVPKNTSADIETTNQKSEDRFEIKEF